MSPKITHLITTIERGGAEKQLLILAREQVKAGFDVEILYLKGDPELKNEFEGAGAKVNPMLAKMSFMQQLSLLRKYLSRKHNLVHAHLPRAELLASLSCHKSAFVFSRHNAEAFWPDGPKIISIFLSRFVALRAARGIAISNSVKDYLISNKEIPAKYPIEVIYYGFDSQNTKTSFGQEYISSRIHKNPNQIIIGTIGRLVPQKDYPTLLHAFAHASKILPNLVLFVIGEGSLKNDLVVLCQELNITEKVHWLGKTQYVQEFLSAIDIFILTSIYEGFGLVLLEAMSAGKTILGANNSAIPEVLGKDYPGLFTTGDWLELSKKIIKMESNLARNKLESISSARLKEFTSEKMLYRITNTYNSSCEFH